MIERDARHGKDRIGLAVVACCALDTRPFASLGCVDVSNAHVVLGGGRNDVAAPVPSVV